MARRRHILTGTMVATLAVLLTIGAVTAQEAESDTVIYSEISGDPDNPRRHFRVKNPATLTPGDAQSIYAAILPGMLAGYGLNESPVATDYVTWPRYNTAPCRSATHGQRFINNYANAVAQNYGAYEDAGVLPVGSILAKDSFKVTDDGVVQPGPLFLMEKMPEG
ncbi:MAG: hypothetical protein HN577_16475, partial [Rhodospirillaceae bacterium]|nr:hypothetical protein [Rhodospirillaceae bacterium]